jgi:cytochrome c oxidase subunit II
MTNILIILVALLVVATLVQLLRVGELLSEVKNQDVNKVTEKDNKTQGLLVFCVGFLFVLSVVWQFVSWGPLMLPSASSEHGEKIDVLMKFTTGLIVFVFFILHPVLFGFAYKYAKHEKKSSNSMIRIIIILITGFYWVWIATVMGFPSVLLNGPELQHLKDGILIFSWEDIFHIFYYCLPVFFWVFTRKVIGNKNAYYYPHNNKLELIWTIAPTIVLTVVILYGLSVWSQITNADTSKSEVIEVYGKQFDWKARYPGEDKTLGSYNYKLVQGLNALGVDMDDETSLDDKVTRELHLVVDKPVLLKFRSQDIIHSAFLPHFRVQMNCVPGMSTQFAFTPTKTTSEMKDKEGEDFEYVLLCNKICGVAHYNMQMKVVVETQEKYDAWLAEQNTLSEKLLTQK